MTIKDVVHEAEWFAGRYRPIVLARLIFEPILAVVADRSFQRAGISVWACNAINAIMMLVSFLAIQASRRLFPIRP